MSDTIFSNIPDTVDQSTAPWTNLITETADIKVFADAYPVTAGHLLFVPKFNTMSALQTALENAMQAGKHLVESSQCDGFNIGLNYGTAAGQTVPWPHVHMIPRRTGDCADPVGGVRGVIPSQQNYKNGTYQMSL